MGFPYLFRRAPDNLGSGADSYGLVGPHIPARADPYSPHRMVRGSMAATATPGFMMLNRRLVPVSNLGVSGLSHHGQFAATPLAEQKG